MLDGEHTRRWGLNKGYASKNHDCEATRERPTGARGLQNRTALR